MILSPITNTTKLREFANNPDLGEFFRRFPPIWSLSDEALLRALQGYYYVGRGDEVLGLVSMTSLDGVSRKAELGIALLPVTNRRELAQQALAQLADYVFEYLDYQKIWMQLLSHREDIKYCLSAAGFKEEALLRRSIFWAGSYHDEIVMGLLKEEYVHGR